MHQHLTAILNALYDVKLLPRQPLEVDVLYGYVAPLQRAEVIAAVVESFETHGYEVHQCAWGDEVVLLVLSSAIEPLAVRLTSSTSERYNLYTLSRPNTAQALWQWAHQMFRQHVRTQRDH